MNSKLLLSVAALTFAAVPVAHASEDEQAWGTVTIKAKASDTIRIENEAVFRVSDAKGFYEIENNFMVGYKPNKNLTLYLGYTFDPQYNHGSLTSREHRFRQQVNVDQIAKIGNVKLSGRVRMEERWREGIDGTGWRLRPQVKATMPFVGKSTFSVSSEPFFNLNKTSFQKVTGLDRMRNAASVSIPLSKRVSFDVGYLNQYTFVRGGADSVDHVLTTGITASF